METVIIGKETSITTIMILTAYLLWCIQTYSTDGYDLYKEWRSLTKRERVFAGINVAFGVLLTAVVLLLFRVGIGRLTPTHQFLWNQGLSIGTAIALCIVVSTGFIGIFSGTWLDHLQQNLKTVRHYTFLVSSVFLGVFLGLTAKAYNPSFVWIPSVESIVGLFLAVFLMSLIVGLLNNAFTFVPTPEQMRFDPFDSVERGLIALKNRIVATPLYHKINTLDGKWPTEKTNRYRLVIGLLFVMFLASVQIIFSRIINWGVQTGLSKVNPPEATVMLGILNIFLFCMMIFWIITVSSIIIKKHRQQKSAL